MSLVEGPSRICTNRPARSDYILPSAAWPEPIGFDEARLALRSELARRMRETGIANVFGRLQELPEGSAAALA